ncbi:MAG: GDSL-like Lipase/Acylhydrolase [Bacteroidetes bacterium ADurb.Bin141]|nr:MAG: GDSL-like Lipase/Acylhydrolase [Bacteroidetes bacterium ADurb.Bin141]
MATYNTEPFAIDYHNARLSGFKTEKTAKNKIVFSGDSMIEFGQWQDLLNNSTIISRGILGDNSFGLLNRIDDIIGLQPKILFVMIGINDIAGNIPIKVSLNNIGDFANQIIEHSPSTKIFVHSILPTNSVHSEHRAEFINHYNKNDQVVALNNLLKSQSDFLKFTFIDLYRHFTDERGNLNSEFANADGLHLNTKGYKLWADLLNSENYMTKK